MTTTATDTTADSPTTYGTRDGFDYAGFGWSEACRPPTDYVVAFGMAQFRGPDGHLWFSPDPEPGGIGTGCPQNVAEYDREHVAPDILRGAEYLASQAAMCAAVDAVTASAARYHRAMRGDS